MLRARFTPARGFLLGLALLLVCGMVSPALAGPITYKFTGTVDSVDAGLAGTFSVGQALTGSYTFESTTPARAGSNSTFAVFDALTALSFSIGGYSASSAGASEIQVDNDPGAPDHDRYGVVSRASDGLTGPAVGGNALNFFGFRLDDSTNAVFSDALILPTSLSLSSFDSTPPSRRFFVFFGPITSPQVVSGTITGLAAVPEPGSLALGLAGAAGVAAWRRKRRPR